MRTAKKGSSGREQSQNHIIEKEKDQFPYTNAEFLEQSLE